MNFKILKLAIFFILLFSIQGCSDNSSTWAPRAKYLVATQCGLFTKVRIYTKKYTEKEIKLLLYFKEHGEINLQGYTKKDKEVLHCCTEKIMDRYTQDEYMSKDDAKLELQIALDQCK